MPETETSRCGLELARLHGSTAYAAARRAIRRAGECDMSAIGRLWAGQLFGTNTGNLAAELTNTETGFTGIVRFLDNTFGIVVYAVTGTFDGTTIEFTGTAQQAAPNTETGTVTARGTLNPGGDLRGEWSSTIGTGGIFVLFPHDGTVASQPATAGMPPATRKADRRSRGDPTAATPLPNASRRPCGRSGSCRNTTCARGRVAWARPSDRRCRCARHTPRLLPCSRR